MKTHKINTFPLDFFYNWICCLQNKMMFVRRGADNSRCEYRIVCEKVELIFSFIIIFFVNLICILHGLFIFVLLTCKIQ